MTCSSGCCLQLFVDGPVQQDVRLMDVNDNPITGAAVTATLLDRAGDEVPGVTWPLTLVELGAGVYRLAFDGHDLEVVAGQRAELKVTAVFGAITATKSCRTVAKQGALVCA